MIELALLGFGLLVFILSLIALARGYVVESRMRALIQHDLGEAKVSLAGIEPRLEKYFEKRLAEVALDLRQVCQNDTVEIIKNSKEELQAYRNEGNAMMPGSFRSFQE